MDQIRRKTIHIDGADFIISPLTLKKTREFGSEDTKVVSIIAFSLSRASGTEVTEEQLDEILDPQSRELLFNEILCFSGLKMQGQGGAENPTSA